MLMYQSCINMSNTHTTDRRAQNFMSDSQTPGTGKVPLAVQITELLIRDIRSGALPDGEKLPPERQMAQKLGISTGTLRKALSELESRGLLRRVQGSGNYISHDLDQQDVYALFRLELIDAPARPSARLLTLERLEKPSGLPFIGESGYAFRFRRIRMLDQREAALEEIWLDGRHAQQIDAANVGDSLYRFYSNVLGCRITRVEDRVTARSLPAWAPPAWKERHQQDWGFIERLSRDQHGEAAEFSRTWFDPVHVRFVSR